MELDRKMAKVRLYENVSDEYQRHHARMVASSMEGYAGLYGEDKDLWYITGLLHDVDFERHPDTHPAEALKWIKGWNYPERMIHAVEAHAYGYNSFKTEPRTKLAAALLACDEICGIFYAYGKLNPVPYGEMNVSSLKKRFKEKKFAAKIDREVVKMGMRNLNLDLHTHVENLIGFLTNIKE